MPQNVNVNVNAYHNTIMLPTFWIQNQIIRHFKGFFFILCIYLKHHLGMSPLKSGSVGLSVISYGAAKWDLWQLYTTLTAPHPGQSFHLIPFLLRHIHHSGGASHIELYDFPSQCHTASAHDLPATRSSWSNIRRSSITLKSRSSIYCI